MSNSTSIPLSKNTETAGPLWVKVTIPIFVLTALTVMLRVWWRSQKTGKMALTDIAIAVSLLCAFLQEVIGCIAILKWGLGHHAAYIGVHSAQKALMYFYLYQIFYKIMVGTTKLSFVFLYLDLFPFPPSFRLTCHIVNVSIFAAIIAYVSGTIFQCTPIPYFWNKTIHGGHCINVAGFWYGHAAWNTAFDVLVLLLPIPVIRSLQMGRRQKLAVMGVFGLGGFVILASIMRMIALDPASKTTQKDMTYVISTSNALLWTQIESCVGIICACLPTLKGLIIKFLPNIFSSQQSSREAYEIGELGKKGSGVSWKDDTTASTKITASKKKYEDHLEIEESNVGLGITKTVDVNVSSLKDGSSSSF